MGNHEAIAVVADSEEFYSAGIAAVLEHQFGFGTVATATSLDQLMTLLATRRVGLAVVADDLAGCDGAATVKLLRSRYPDLRLAIVSPRSDDRQVLRLLAAGAHGVMARPNGDCRELMRGLTTVNRGSIFVPASANSHDDVGLSHLEAGETTALAGLTERQQQVIRLLSDGHPNKVIARVLGISPSTVKVHVHAAFRALGVHNRLAAVAALRPRSLTHHRPADPKQTIAMPQ